jgi:phosphatidyl-myo-inositol dimannoside synthase
MANHLLVTNDYPPKTGGIQNYLHELWSRLEPGRAVVLTARSADGASAFDAAANLPIERVRARTLYLPTRRARQAIEAAIARHQPQFVLFDPAWPLGLLGAKLSVPYGVVLHGAEVAIPARLPVVRGSLRRVLAGASVAVCAGSYPEAEAGRLVGPGALAVLAVPPGVNPTRFAPLDQAQRAAVRADMGLPGDRPIIASFSRLVPRKGMDTLIRAAARLRATSPQPLVVIGGDGRDKGRLQRLAHRLRADVTFLGRVDDDQIARWLAACDLMVLDCRSRWAGLEQEGFGIVLMEAASCGVAQVAGRSGGSHEAVVNGETGLVVDDARSANDLAAAIQSLLRDDARRTRYGVRSRERAVEEFDWRALARRLSAGLAPYDGYLK